MMNTAWKVIEKLIKENATHRRGFKLQSVSISFIISQARDELNELDLSPNDPTEMADLLGVLFHYSIKQGWTLEQLEKLLLQKLAERFTV